jgi:PEP-CTERM motif-containing protein
MFMARALPFRLAVSIALGLAAGAAQATLTPLTNESFTTLTSANVMATIQNDGTESGGSRLLSNGTPAVAPSNTILPWQTLTIAQLGLASAADFRLIVSPLETDGVLSSSSIGVQFFSPTGAILYTATTSQTFDLDTSAMVGQGFVFGLDAEQAAEAQAAAFGDTNNVVGVFGTFVDSTGGPETLFGASRQGVTPPPVAQIPEPGTYALMSAGLLACMALVRLQRRRG